MKEYKFTHILQWLDTLHIYKIHSYNTSKYKAGIKLFDTQKKKKKFLLKKKEEEFQTFATTSKF